MAIFLFVIGAAVKARARKVVTGRESMIGARVEVMEDFIGRGIVRLHGEIWQATSHIPLAKGAQVRIVGIDDLILTVEPQE